MKTPAKKSSIIPKFFKKLILFVLILWFLFSFVFGISRVSGNNMYPAVRDGDLVISLRIGKPHINDVVQYRKNGKNRLGRIIALPDSEITISDEQTVQISGSEISEQIFYPTEKGTLSYPYHTNSNSYFILNDFRSDLQDSRTFGGISTLKGRAVFILRHRGI